MKSSMTKTTHRGMIIIARFPRSNPDSYGTGQAIPTYSAGQVMAIEKQIINI
jgi:hypothetical protein